MKTVTIKTLQKMKAAGEKIAMLTAYDACFATLQQQNGIDIILVGDSLGMVLQGNSSTIPVTIEDMIYHTRCVAASALSLPTQYASDQSSTAHNLPHKALIMSDMPFMGCATLEQTLDYSTRLMQAGAHIIKLEGDSWLTEPIQALARGGIPVCAHLGLTPQSVNALGGYKVQGRGDAASKKLLQSAEAIEAAGAAMLLVECIPATLGRQLSDALSIPVIGIGAGADCDGQVLVMHDMLGLTPGKPAKFVKNFMQESDTPQEAFQQYSRAVKQGLFPSKEHTFSDNH